MKIIPVRGYIVFERFFSGAWRWGNKETQKKTGTLFDAAAVILGLCFSRRHTLAAGR
jgi:hypothetical protein